MAIFSASLLLRTITLFHSAIAYILITNPSLLASQSLVYILGESMGIPAARGFSSPSSSTALAGSFLLLLALSDFVSIGSSETAVRWWSMQAPIRLVFFFALTAWSYLAAPASKTAKVVAQASGQGVGNSVVFTWAFVELGLWFWIYNALIAEKQALSRKAALETNRKIELEGREE